MKESTNTLCVLVVAVFCLESLLFPLVGSARSKKTALIPPGCEAMQKPVQPLDALFVFAEPAHWVEEYEFFGLTRDELVSKFASLQERDEFSYKYKVSSDGLTASILNDGGMTYDLKYLNGRVSQVKGSSHSCNGGVSGIWIDSKDEALRKSLSRCDGDVSFAEWQLNHGSDLGRLFCLSYLGKHLVKRSKVFHEMGLPAAAARDQIRLQGLLKKVQKIRNASENEYVSAFPKLSQEDRGRLMNKF